MDNHKGTLKYPINIQVEVTEACNQDCFYCYNHWRTDNNPPKRMSKKTAWELSEIIVNDIQPFEAVITGGEPLTNLSATTELMKGFQKNKLNYSLNSNLTLLNKPTLDKLVSISPKLGILTSLPSHKQEIFEEIVGRDNLLKFYENLELALRNNISVAINMVAHKLNKDDVYEEGKFLIEKYGIKTFLATPMLRPSLREADSPLSNDEIIRVLEDLVRLRKDYGVRVESLEVIPKCMLPDHLREDAAFERACTAGRSSIMISYKGDVRACGHSPISAGNLFKEGFRKIWENLRPFRKNEYVPQECKECAELAFCRGGCRFEGYQEGDSLDKKDSRMNQALKQRKSIPLPQADINRDYMPNPFKCRKEDENAYTLYSNGKVIFANKGLRDFLYEINSMEKFKLSEIPEGKIREKAKLMTQLLLEEKFLR